MKKTFMLFCCVFMLMLVPVKGIKAETITASGEIGTNLTWNLDSDGVLTISGEGEMEDGVRPWYDQGYMDDISKVVIGEGVTSISKYAFCNYIYNPPMNTAWTIPGPVTKNINEVILPDSLESIGDYSFCGCANLKSIVIPDNVTQIGANIFKECAKLQFIKIPDSFTTIPKEMFSGCTGLTTVTLHEGITSIDNGAFSGCSNLQSIELPIGLETIGEQAFYNCKSLESVILPDGVKKIGSRAFGKTAYGTGNLKYIKIPDSVEEVGDGFVEGYYGSLYNPLYTFIICSPQCLLAQEDSKYKDICLTQDEYTGSAGRNITYNFKLSTGELTYTGSGAFYSDFDLKPDGIKGTLSPLVQSCEVNVSNASGCSFAYYRSLQEIYLPDDMKAIAGQMFNECLSLEKINIPAGVTSIGYNAFTNCKKLSKLDLPDGITTIGWGAFKGCESLIQIQLPQALESLSQGLFDDCISLQKVKIPEGISPLLPEGLIGYGVFRGCTSLKEINIPASLGSIIDNMFENCISLEKIILPKGVNRIGDNAFSGCTALKNITIQDEQMIIGQKAFYNCVSLENAVILAKQATIASSAFDHADKMTIYGYKESDIESYAQDNSIPFQEFEHDCVSVEEAGVEPTCTEKGKTAGSVCSICGKTLVKSEEVPALGHCYHATFSWNDNNDSCRVKLVCSKDSSHIVEGDCSVSCVETEATCTQKGKKVCIATFTLDGNSYVNRKEVETDAKGHQWDSGTVAAGIKTYTCKNCQIKKMEVVASDIDNNKITEADSDFDVTIVSKLSISKVNVWKIKPAKKMMKITWKPVQDADGYEIQYSTKANFKNADIKDLSASKKSLTIKKLKNNKKFYVRIRAYRIYKDEAGNLLYVYSNWTKKSKKIK